MVCVSGLTATYPRKRVSYGLAIATVAGCWLFSVAAAWHGATTVATQTDCHTACAECQSEDPSGTGCYGSGACCSRRNWCGAGPDWCRDEQRCHGCSAPPPPPSPPGPSSFTSSFQKVGGEGCGNGAGGNDISCGEYGSQAELEAACIKENKCVAYSTWDEKSGDGGPWCMKSTYVAGDYHDGHDCYIKGVDIGPSNPDWELVRRVAAGTGSWHPATDNLRGVNVYGGPDCETCDSTFSISWADVPFTYFLFATGDKKKWLVASKDAVIGRHYMDEQRDIVTSSDSPTPYQARWYNRNGVLDPEDPLVSIIDHHSAITADKIVYAEDSIDSHLSVLNNHNGANVYILPDSRTGGDDEPASMAKFDWFGMCAPPGTKPMHWMPARKYSWILTADGVDGEAATEVLNRFFLIAGAAEGMTFAHGHRTWIGWNRDSNMGEYFWISHDRNSATHDYCEKTKTYIDSVVNLGGASYVRCVTWTDDGEKDQYLAISGVAGCTATRNALNAALFSDRAACGGDELKADGKCAPGSVTTPGGYSWFDRCSAGGWFGAPDDNSYPSKIDPIMTVLNRLTPEGRNKLKTEDRIGGHNRVDNHGSYFYTCTATECDAYKNTINNLLDGSGQVRCKPVAWAGHLECFEDWDEVTYFLAKEESTDCASALDLFKGSIFVSSKACLSGQELNRDGSCAGPTPDPTGIRTKSPTRSPTNGPTRRPTESPSRGPTKSPTGNSGPTTHASPPSNGPSQSPTTNDPSPAPSVSPSASPTHKRTPRPPELTGTAQFISAVTSMATESPAAPTPSPLITASPTESPVVPPTGKPTLPRVDGNNTSAPSTTTLVSAVAATAKDGTSDVMQSQNARNDGDDGGGSDGPGTVVIVIIVVAVVVLLVAVVAVVYWRQRKHEHEKSSAMLVARERVLTESQKSPGMSSNPMLAADPAAAVSETYFGRRQSSRLDQFDFLASDETVLRQVYGQGDGSEDDGIYASIPSLLDVDNKEGHDYDSLQQILAEFVQSNLYSDLVSSNLKKKQRFLRVLETMEYHYRQYQNLFESLENNIGTRVAVSALEATDRRVRAEMILQAGPDPAVQPNTFTPAVAPDSMKYLEQVIAVFATKLAGSPSPFGPCEAIAAGVEGVCWKQGKPKKPKRVVEKALLNESRYDQIRDYARGSFIVDDNNMMAMAVLVEHVAAEPAYRVIRTKNRFARGYSADESCGYRDYQLLVRLADGWILEIQIIPRGVYDIKAKLGAKAAQAGSKALTGHDAYKEFRAIRESRQRHHMAQSSLRPFNNSDDSCSSTQSLKERFSKYSSIDVIGFKPTPEHDTTDFALDPPPRRIIFDEEHIPQTADGDKRDVVLNSLPPRPGERLRAPPSTVHVKSARVGSVYDVPMDNEAPAAPNQYEPSYAEWLDHKRSPASVDPGVAGKLQLRCGTHNAPVYEGCAVAGGMDALSELYDLGAPDHAVPTTPSDGVYSSPLPTPDAYASSFQARREHGAATGGAFSFSALDYVAFSSANASRSGEDIAPEVMQMCATADAPPPYADNDDTFDPALGFRPLRQISVESYREAPYLHGEIEETLGLGGGVGRQISDV